MHRRQAIPISPATTSSSLLSPIVSHFPALSGISPFKALRQSPSYDHHHPASTSPPHSEYNKAVWQEGDLGDGKGIVPLLLVTSSVCALQIFSVPTPVASQDPRLPESFNVPEEMFAMSTITYGSSLYRGSLSGVNNGGSLQCSTHSETVLDMALMDGGRVALVTCNPDKTSIGPLALVVVNLESGRAEVKVDLGVGSTAGVHVSHKIIAITVSHPSPAIHFLDPGSFLPLLPPIMDAAPNALTQLPTIALSGRLLAYVTSSPAKVSNPNDMGSLVTSSSLRASHSRKQQGPTGQVESHQGALISSAVEIGGGVARGVWAGLKLGAKAASAATRARSDRLAQSAPDDTATFGRDQETKLHGDAESRSLDDGSILDEALPTNAANAKPIDKGEWIHVIDLFSRHPSSTCQVSPPGNATLKPTPSFTTIAHFRLPPSSVVPIDTSHSSQYHSLPVQHLSFSPSGTTLLAAPADGRSFHVLEFHPAPLKGNISTGSQSQAWHLYELKRGHTIAKVRWTSWDRMGNWVGIGTDRGTIHIYPIHPSGGQPSAITHAAGFRNAQRLFALSIPVSPIVRIRPPRLATDPSHLEGNLDPDSTYSENSVFGFLPFRQHQRLDQKHTQDIGIFRWPAGVLEITRMTVRGCREDDSETGAAKYSSGSPPHRTRSALTELMLSRAARERNSLAAEKITLAKWALPSAVAMSSPTLLSPTTAEKSQRSRMGALAAAEIRTHHFNPHVLPSSIYLSRQIEFFSARPIDDYSPLSILDLEARTDKLVFRQEVEARSPPNEDTETPLSFDQPLLSALHDLMESPSDRQIPGLPNGYGRTGIWMGDPIQTVRYGLNEGVDRVRREYVRAQLIKQRKLAKRNKETSGLSLSFEDDAVLAVSNTDLRLDNPPFDQSESAAVSGGSSSIPTSEHSTSPPGSGDLPPTKVDSSDGDSQWGEVWEEEYRRAVEDDGGPDDLVLGLLDEEEDERRKWEARRKP
ncbi:hypothetical protein I305_00954 [Cryptococcus gattii E566]|uniref:BCAS3 WD40 domain-containing protein n=1 Tax=Cryptococcus gattii serotype B (strain WM276 / ATCC MYA-4071) TaxID=367775 RepID=E6R3F0_CRYGW|nr:uncharacterized protein CGB_C4320C [Cryptococcus gattii WM276]ADV21037.1 hypothetical protein CNC02860 [Cryptococcus gattii WM276]KIY36905.1 hypothetical protein I305_00954 [Cryptococcus gattii E566]